jgi:DNA invertase Pin-like site-specific DNA recombinase
LCAWQDTLLIDEEGVYDSNVPNDQLMLGIRGLMGASELDILRRRMQVSREEKARRGERRFQAPTGFVHDRQGKLRLDPDEEIQEAIRLLFEQFRRGSCGFRGEDVFAEDRPAMKLPGYGAFAR